ncbi:hypothetical protein [Nitrosomonas sp.]|uniref:hypothetical protein n=1 Tax=Nitrosomonas sp. TaxID=42353 RepID=UPI0025CE8EFB|nr:hypothetical protein [Nitrosomonas sp.]
MHQMLLGGMGPVNTPITFGGKLFVGMYALYCGLIVIVAAALFSHRLYIASFTDST